ncbi:MAG: hypothetical protein O7B26_01915, partial [Planctomycetota bacterium]|nr:hypothetical protein [Planctomycetota bacterium]
EMQESVDAHIRSCAICNELVGPAFVSARHAVQRHGGWGRQLFAHRRAIVAAAVLLFAGLGLIMSYAPGQRLAASETPDWIYRAQWLGSDEKPESVLFVIDEGLRRDPGHVMGVVLKARLLQRLHRLNDAKRLVTPLLWRADSAWIGHAVLAEIAIGEGDESGHEYHINRSAELKPGPSRPDFQDSLLHLAMLQGDAHAEIAMLDLVIEENADNRDARYLRACRHRELAVRNARDRCGRDHPEAMLADADELVRHNPGWTHAWTARAEANRIRRKYASAVEDCNAAIRLEPHATVYLIRGKCLRRMNRAADALQDFYHVFNMDPSRRQAADAYIELALAYRDLPKYGVVMRQALDELNLSIEQGSENIIHYAYRCKGVIHLLNRQSSRARIDFESALERSPGNAYTSLLLWQVLRSEGHAEAADRIIQDAFSALAEDIQNRSEQPGRAWPALLVGYYAGKFSREYLIAEAASALRHCEASYYIGEKVLCEEGPDAARVWFQRCIATDVRHLDEYHLARRRLDGTRANASDRSPAASVDIESYPSDDRPAHRI